MTHQIPPHLAFCTPRQNQKTEQGTNPETLKKKKKKAKCNTVHTPTTSALTVYIIYLSDHNKFWKTED